MSLFPDKQILDIPKIQLEETGNFGTVDDDLLANVIHDTVKENS